MSAPLDPDRVEADELDRATLRKMAAMAADFYDACRDAGLPDAVCAQMVTDWHAQVISPEGIEWSDDDD